jgi:hypothetical protein
MKINIDDANGINYPIEIDIKDIKIPDDYFLNKKHEEGLNIFKVKHRVPDVWRYTFKVYDRKVEKLTIVKKIKESKFNDCPSFDAIGTKVILLLLESPHKDEYSRKHTKPDDLNPIAPAQNITGDNIKNNIHKLLEKIALPDSFYSLIVANPIAYVCSLGVFQQDNEELNETVRDNIWKAIWKIKDNDSYVFQEEFINRCSNYQPEYIINCCTDGLQKNVTEVLFNNGFSHNLYTAYHPSCSGWNTDKFNLKKIISLGISRK